MRVKASEPSITHLEYLVAALDHGSWTDAADALGVSASAFVQGMGELERRVGLTLFGKEGRRRVPTDEGSVAGGHARRVLRELASMSAWAEQSRSGDVGQVRAGLIDTAAVHHFGDALVRFRTLHPDLSVRLTVRPSVELFELLRSGELDVVVAVAPDDLTDLATRPLVAEPLYIYAPPGVDVGAAAQWGPWVGFPEASRSRALVAAELRALGADYNIVAESSQPAVLREMVRLGMGWTVLAAVDAEREPHSLTRAIERPVAERVLTLATRTTRQPTAAVERFTAMLVGEATIESAQT